MNRSRGTSGALEVAISAFVFAGLPTTRTLMSSAAPALIASPCGLKIAAVGLEQVGALHARTARARAHQQADVRALEGSLGVVEDVDAGEEPEGTVVELHRGALGGLDGVGDLEQVQVDLGIRAEQLAAGHTEEQGVADLSGGAGHGRRVRGCHSRAGSP